MTSLIASQQTDDSALSTFRRLVFSRGDEDPFPLYARLRETPVLHSPLPNLLGGYVLSRHRECSQALRSRAMTPFSGEHVDRFLPDWREHTAGRLLYQSLVFAHDDRHAEVRRRLSPHFSRSRTAALREFMTDLASRQVEALAAADGPVDLVEALTLPFPLAVICRLFDVDFADAAPLARSGRTLSCFLETVQTPARRNRIDRAADEFVEFFAEPIRQRRRSPGDDLLSTLVNAADTGAIDEQELLGNLLFLFTAGYDSSTSFLGAAVRTLLAHPDQAAVVRDDPDAIGGAVDELLRYDPPVHATTRITAQPVELGGTELPTGSLVWILLGSANRDPAFVTDPDTVDVGRPAQQHLSFAAGPHTCIGARLARMEAEVLLPMLLRRFPRMRLAGEPRHRYPGTVLRGIDRLPVVLE